MQTIKDLIKKANETALYRTYTIERSSIDEKTRTIPLSFSSEEPVERWWGVEILDHGPGSVDMSRMKKGSSMLVDHDMTKLVGVIETASIDSTAKKGRASVRFGKRGLADDVYNDILDGIRPNTSVGYEIIDMVLEREVKDGPSVYRATRWMPYEISSVSVPADITVGVGRQREQIDAAKQQARADAKPACHSMDMPADKKPEDMPEPMNPGECMMGEDCANARCSTAKKAPRATKPKEERQMKTCNICGATLEADGTCKGPKHAELVSARAKASESSVRDMEEARKKAIRNLCSTNNLGDKYEEHWIRSGASLEQVADDIVALFEERGRKNPNPKTKIGLSDAETQQFSISRAIKACVTNDWKDAGLELEASRAVAKNLNRHVEPGKFLVPFEVMQRPIGARDKRDLSVASGGGSYLVETQNVGFIELLYNRSVVLSLGARRLSGLVGNVTIPRMSAGGTAYWLANETTQITESAQTIQQVSLSPKNVGAYTEISHQLMIQSSPAADGLVMGDLASTVAVAADLACLAGAGASGEPDGIIGFSGVGAVTGTALAYAGVLNFQEDVATANVRPVRGGYATTPAVASLMMQRVKFTSTASPLWEGNLWDGSMAGFPAMSSNQIPAATMIFGDWNEMLVAEWGVLEIAVNPAANFQAAIIGVRAIYTMDVGHRRPAAFSIADANVT